MHRRVVVRRAPVPRALLALHDPGGAAAAGGGAGAGPEPIVPQGNPLPPSTSNLIQNTNVGVAS